MFKKKRECKECKTKLNALLFSEDTNSVLHKRIATVQETTSVLNKQIFVLEKEVAWWKEKALNFQKNYK